MNLLKNCRNSALKMILLLPVLAGCSGGDGFDRVSIQGKATFNNQPIEEASFTLVPPVEAKNSPSVYGIISQGKYYLPRKIGPVPGPHRVELTILGKSDKPSSSEAVGTEVKELGSYTTEIVVPDNGSDSLDIVVTSEQKST